MDLESAINLFNSYLESIFNVPSNFKNVNSIVWREKTSKAYISKKRKGKNTNDPLLRIAFKKEFEQLVIFEADFRYHVTYLHLLRGMIYDIINVNRSDKRIYWDLASIFILLLKENSTIIEKRHLKKAHSDFLQEFIESNKSQVDSALNLNTIDLQYILESKQKSRDLIKILAKDIIENKLDHKTEKEIYLHYRSLINRFTFKFYKPKNLPLYHCMLKCQLQTPQNILDHASNCTIQQVKSMNIEKARRFHRNASLIITSQKFYNYKVLGLIKLSLLIYEEGEISDCTSPFLIDKHILRNEKLKKIYMQELSMYIFLIPENQILKALKLIDSSYNLLFFGVDQHLELHFTFKPDVDNLSWYSGEEADIETICTNIHLSDKVALEYFNLNHIRLLKSYIRNTDILDITKRNQRLLMRRLNKYGAYYNLMKLKPKNTMNRLLIYIPISQYYPIDKFNLIDRPNKNELVKKIIDIKPIQMIIKDRYQYTSNKGFRFVKIMEITAVKRDIDRIYSILPMEFILGTYVESNTSKYGVPVDLYDPDRRRWKFNMKEFINVSGKIIKERIY